MIPFRKEQWHHQSCSPCQMRLFGPVCHLKARSFFLFRPLPGSGQKPHVPELRPILERLSPDWDLLAPHLHRAWQSPVLLLPLLWTQADLSQNNLCLPFRLLWHSPRIFSFPGWPGGRRPTSLCTGCQWSSAPLSSRSLSFWSRHSNPLLPG